MLSTRAPQQRPSSAPRGAHLCSWALIALSLCLTSRLEARCLLSAEEGAPLSQGDVIADLGGMGGSQGGGYALGARLGLTGNRELQLRVGGCQRALSDPLEERPELNLWGNALDFGLKQGLLSVEETGLVALSVALSAGLLSADDGEERGDAYSSRGFTPRLLISYPFEITADREGFLSLSLGASAQFIDQNRQDSLFELSPVIDLTGGAELIPLLSLRGALSWRDQGVFGGASVAYRF